MKGTLFPRFDSLDLFPEGEEEPEADPDAEAENLVDDSDVDEEEVPVESLPEVTWEKPPIVLEDLPTVPEAPPPKAKPLAKEMSKFLALRLVHGNPSKKDFEEAPKYRAVSKATSGGSSSSSSRRPSVWERQRGGEIVE